MNTQRKILASVGIMLLAATASFAQQLKTEYDRSTDFSQYKTYSWEKVQTQDPLWADRIKEAVNGALAAKGCHISSCPDSVTRTGMGCDPDITRE